VENAMLVGVLVVVAGLVTVVVEDVLVGVLVVLPEVVVELLDVVVLVVVVGVLEVVAGVLVVVAAVLPVDELVDAKPLAAVPTDSPHADNKPIENKTETQRSAFVIFIETSWGTVLFEGCFLARIPPLDKLSPESDAMRRQSM
jgi:hypothetical protein